MKTDPQNRLVQLRGYTLLEPSRTPEGATEVVRTSIDPLPIRHDPTSFGDLVGRDLASLRQSVTADTEVLDPVAVIVLTEPGSLVSEADRNATLDSVLGQVYPKIELIAEQPEFLYASVFDLSDRIELRSYDGSSTSIRTSLRNALSAVRSDLVVILRLGDRLSADALYQLRTNAIRYPSSSIFYSDLVSFDTDGRRHGPIWHGSWDWLLMLQHNAAEGLIGVRTRAISNVTFEELPSFYMLGWWLYLRLSTNSPISSPVHIANLLYIKSDHTLSIKPGTDTSQGAMAHEGFRSPDQSWTRNLPAGVSNALGVVEQHIQSTGIRLSVREENKTNKLRLQTDPTDYGKVSILIPTRNRPVLLANLVDSIRRNNYPEVEIIMIDDASDQRTSIEMLAEIERITDHSAKVIRSNVAQFNYSRLVNLGRESADGEYLLIVHDDIELASTDSIASLVGLLELDDIGLVGARLLTKDLRIDHVGLAVGTDRLFRGYLAGEDPKSPHADCLVDSVHRASAVCGALHLVKATIFDNLGGYDAERFPISFGAVDFCLRVGQLGYQVAVDTRPTIFRHNGAADPYVMQSQYHLNAWIREQSAFAQRWAGRLVSDPFFPRNRETRLAWEPAINNPMDQSPVLR